MIWYGNSPADGVGVNGTGDVGVNGMGGVADGGAVSSISWVGVGMPEPTEVLVGVAVATTGMVGMAVGVLVGAVVEVRVGWALWVMIRAALSR